MVEFDTMASLSSERGYLVHLEPAEMASFVKKDYENKTLIYGTRPPP